MLALHQSEVSVQGWQNGAVICDLPSACSVALHSVGCCRRDPTDTVPETAEPQTAAPIHLSGPSGSQFGSLDQRNLGFVQLD